MCVSNFAGVSHLALLFRIVTSHGPHGRPSITRSIVLQLNKAYQP